MVLSELKASIIGTENGFKLLRFYLSPKSEAPVDRLAWEVAYLFNLFLDNHHRENGLRLLRCYILQAGDMQDDCAFHREDTEIEYAFKAPVVEGGAACHRLQATHKQEKRKDWLSWSANKDAQSPTRSLLLLRQGGTRCLHITPLWTTHVATFASMLRRAGYHMEKRMMQSTVHLLEASLRDRLAGRSPLHHEIAEVDKLLDSSWCGTSLRRDFIRGALLDLLLLALAYGVGVVVLDDNEACRLNRPSARTLVMRVDSTMLNFEPAAILDEEEKSCDLCVDLDPSEFVNESVVWCGPTHLRVAAI
eukprot:6473831-Amphidinium_carterae.1